MAIKEQTLYIPPDGMDRLIDGMPIVIQGMGTTFKLVPEPDPEDIADLERKEVTK